jgi:predicted benzoate:H+ symporter BenE
VERLARIVPDTVAAGLQLGLGLALAGLGLKLLRQDPWLGLLICGVILAFLNSRVFPAAIAALVVGVAAGQIFGTAPPIPAVQLGLHLPSLVIPTWSQFVHGLENAVLPQIPLTLTTPSSSRPP